MLAADTASTTGLPLWRGPKFRNSAVVRRSRLGIQRCCRCCYFCSRCRCCRCVAAVSFVFSRVCGPQPKTFAHTSLSWLLLVMVVVELLCLFLVLALALMLLLNDDDVAMLFNCWGSAVVRRMHLRAHRCCCYLVRLSRAIVCGRPPKTMCCRYVFDRRQARSCVCGRMVARNLVLGLCRWQQCVGKREVRKHVLRARWVCVCV
jgi:hypothetical protein